MRPSVPFHGHFPLQVRPLSSADMGRAATGYFEKDSQTTLLGFEASINNEACGVGSLTSYPGPLVQRRNEHRRSAAAQQKKATLVGTVPHLGTGPHFKSCTEPAECGGRGPNVKLEPEPA